MFNGPTLSPPGPVRITPSDLVTATALRVARAGDDAAWAPEEVSARTSHRGRFLEEEAQQHGESSVYPRRNGFTLGIELAHVLLGPHSQVLRGGARW